MSSAMVADIRQARQRIWLESYIIVDDEAGRAVAEALIERAAAGVEVRLMYDAVGCMSTPQAYFDRLTAARSGSSCVSFDPRASIGPAILSDDESSKSSQAIDR